MNKHFILLSAATVLFFSCARETNQVFQPGETITFTAGWAGEDDTRTVLQSDGTSVWWDAAEQINVFFSDKASGKFTSTNSNPQAIVDFQGSLPIVVGSIESDNPAHAYWAVYPYYAAKTCDGESVTLTVPSIQTAQEGTFANKMFPSIATSTNFHLAFYNVCGGARFSVANEGITSITFKANNGESLVGKVQVGFDRVPVIKKVSEGVSEVTINAPDGGFIPGKYYFATFLPQTLSKGVSLTFMKSDGKVASTSLSQSITINRSRFGKMDEKDKGLEFKDDGSGPDPSGIIVFADSKVKEKLVAAFDTNGDGELSYEEAASVKSGDDLKSAFGAIKTYKSFDEFQYFTGITVIPYGMCASWNLLNSINLPNSLTTIGSAAFQNCVKLSSLVIPDSVTSIGMSTFLGCTSLSSIVIPESVTSIESTVFDGCTSLTSIVIPESVTSIGSGAFSGCTSLSSLVIPESVTSIEASTFYSCTSLASVVMPDSVTSIGGDAFYGCTSLTSIVIPESVTSIGNGVFHGCTSLTSIVIPDRVTGLGTSTFKGCSSLTSIVIPDRVTSIGGGAFSGCTSLTSIVIPESVTSIGGSAFYGCTSLSSLVIPESVTSIRKSTFSGCSSLSSLVIPESVTSIGMSTFLGCTSLSSIVIPESVTSIESRAFEGCTIMKTCTLMADTPPSLGTEAFNSNNCQIYVPAGSVEDYKAASGWSDYADRIQAITE